MADPSTSESARCAIASGDPATAVSELHREIAAFETDLDEAIHQLADMRVRASGAEARAMQDIRAGQDSAARDALVEQQAIVEEAERLEADIDMSRQLLATWYEFLWS